MRDAEAERAGLGEAGRLGGGEPDLQRPRVVLSNRRRLVSAAFDVEVAGRSATTAAPSLPRLIADLPPLPAVVTNHRYDILAWNAEMARLLLDFDTLPPSRPI